MLACFLLAAKGYNQVQSNPLVGCVIVVNNQIIASGYHQKYGQAHAEVNAINQVNDPQLLQNSTLYVNLEPCTHYGKTPPCVDLIVQRHIPKVVVANIDPYQKVSGKGIQALKNAGIQVEQGILFQEGNYVNRAFFTYIQKKRPYVTLKWAESVDGYITSDYPKRISISSPETDLITQKLRAYSDAILIGKNTLWYDNPKLTVRKIPEARNPLRMVVSSNAILPQAAFLWNTDAKTWYIYPKGHGNFLPFSHSFEYVPIENTHPSTILNFLYQKGIKSLLIEGGSTTLQQYISQNLYDEVWIYKSKNVYLNSGIKAPIFEEGLTLFEEKEKNYIYQYSRTPLFADFWKDEKSN
ncbi:MAG: bifunctional diaminohydroxyphosphoribosylaminopyrimidine deaminase/5-amino-6-(5-phosphoribosylamino)uracil reductase RibD [Bacteroidia bacterium]|nr:bifunctional diaminohydroxyphosphoribosylaminopyrimidine deaminase/5-amino-6-(5-phosphoribosylamino)uracil reductase RibD [Bacteroidia bacterium]MDW8347066.1 bifunctional diaminohydroxyphosphoribosylaminopyrimidine deaminase/5-amino-6-(5-phosphoribosylamino)uracil reductase RibD [Bacteroidia bacterium]